MDEEDAEERMRKISKTVRSKIFVADAFDRIFSLLYIGLTIGSALVYSDPILSNAGINNFYIPLFPAFVVLTQLSLCTRLSLCYLSFLYQVYQPVKSAAIKVYGAMWAVNSTITFLVLITCFFFWCNCNTFGFLDNPCNSLLYCCYYVRSSYTPGNESFFFSDGSRGEVEELYDRCGVGGNDTGFLNGSETNYCPDYPSQGPERIRLRPNTVFSGFFGSNATLFALEISLLTIQISLYNLRRRWYKSKGAVPATINGSTDSISNSSFRVGEAFSNTPLDARRKKTETDAPGKRQNGLFFDPVYHPRDSSPPVIGTIDSRSKKKKQGERDWTFRPEDPRRVKADLKEYFGEKASGVVKVIASKITAAIEDEDSEMNNANNNNKSGGMWWWWRKPKRT